MSETEKTWPADTVILHQIGRGPYAPSMSPFPLKLETYLRMTKIPYQNDHEGGFSSKKKTPWMTHNGEDVADSQFCIEYLKEKLGVDTYKDVSAVDKAVARAFHVMFEERTYWCGVAVRWMNHFDETFLDMSLSRDFQATIRMNLSDECYGQGIGRHTEAEQWTLYTGDLRALSDFLGDKKYVLGDEPCEADCAIFGLLAQFRWQLPGTAHTKYFQEECPILMAYCDKMKETFWPDWDQCITHGATKEATA